MRSKLTISICAAALMLVAVSAHAQNVLDAIDADAVQPNSSEGQDKLGNFEIQNLMSQHNQAENLAASVQKKQPETNLDGKVSSKEAAERRRRLQTQKLLDQRPIAPDPER